MANNPRGIRPQKVILQFGAVCPDDDQIAIGLFRHFQDHFINRPLAHDMLNLKVGRNMFGNELVQSFVIGIKNLFLVTRPWEPRSGHEGAH